MNSVVLRLGCSWLLWIMAAFPGHSQINISNNQSALQLARKIVGGGVYISNAVYRGSPQSNGIFDASASPLGLRSGIILSTGRTVSSNGFAGINAPASENASNLMNGNPDADLSLYSGKVTTDASVLEFDFVPAGDSISVRFVFASEEYPFYNCSSFNDAFAFLISGPGFTGRQNIALVPGTPFPIAINTINDGTVSPQGDVNLFCKSISPNAPYTQYYVNNTASQQLVFNGHTTVMVARAKVTPCVSYHIKLVIADAGPSADQRFDSGVFIEANSFKSDGVTLENNDGFYTPDSILLLVEGCRNGKVKLVRPDNLINDPATVNLLYQGTAVNGTDYATLPASVSFAAGEKSKVLDIVPFTDNLAEGSETLRIFIRQSQCTNFFSDSLTIIIKDSVAFFNRNELPVCSAFPSLLEARRVSNTTNSYTWSTGATTASINVQTPGIFWVVNRFAGNCFNVDTFLLTDKDPVVNLGPDKILCEGQVLQLDAQNAGSRYLWHNGLQVQRISLIGTDTAWVRVTNIHGCIKSDTMVADFRPQVVVRLGNDTSLCTYDSLRLGQAPAAGVLYRWSTGNTSSGITARAPARIWVETNLNGCLFRDSVDLFSKRMPVAEAGPSLIIGEGGAARLEAQRNANNVRYSWTPVQHLNRSDIYNPIARPPANTLYTLRVISQDSCILSDTMRIVIIPSLNIPNAFSPNGDGVNDTWVIDKLRSHLYADVQIFDRYGQLVLNALGYDKPWDGTVGGKPVPDGIYYYVIKIDPSRPPQRGYVIIVR